MNYAFAGIRGAKSQKFFHSLGPVEKELADLRELMDERLSPELSILCISEEVSEKARQDAPFMNSFT